MKTPAKKIVLPLLLVAIAVTFNSCENKDAEDNHSGNIVGTWTLVSTSADVMINGESMLDFFMEELNLTKAQAEALAELYLSDLDAEGTIEFKEDGTYVAKIDGDTDEGVYEMSSDNKKMVVDKGTEYETEFNVRTLTSSALVIEFSESDSDDVDLDGNEDQIEMLITMSFKR